MLASQENQNIYATASVPDGLVLIDPDHLKLFHIDSLYNHWLQRQSKGLTPFIILNPIPQHVLKKKISKKASGKRKAEYVEVGSEHSDAEGQSEKSGDEDERLRRDDQRPERDENAAAVKFGPPERGRRKTGVKIPTEQVGPSAKDALEKPKKGKGPKPVPMPVSAKVRP